MSDEQAAADGGPEVTGDPGEEQRRRFREALARKQGAQHPDDTARGGRSLHGRNGDTNRHEFRRKSG
jgi:hypothetical protein